MAFNAYNPGTGVDHSVMVSVIIANSITIALGEAVKLDSSGFATNQTAAVPVLGIVVGFTSVSGSPLQPTAYAAGTATGTDVTSVVAASTNQTVNMYKVLVETSKSKQWSAQVNGTVGTTGSSGNIGAGLDVDSANTHYDRVLETTSTRTMSTLTNFTGLGTDPNDSTRIIVRIASSVFDRNVS